MSDQVAAVARERFDRPELRRMWVALRRRIETSTAPVQRVVVGPLTAEEQTAIADLFGWTRLPGKVAHIPVPKLDRILLDSPTGLDTCGVLEAIGGPIADVAGQRQQEIAEREELWSWLATHPIVTAAPALGVWARNVRSQGLIDRSVTDTRTLLETALRVLERLPVDGKSLPAVASEVCGDPHALDHGRLSSVVLRALAALRDEPWSGSAEQRRQLWADAGVACDALSVTVLTAGLRPHGDGLVAATMRTWAEAAQATQTTLAQLRHQPVTLLPPGLETVRVVENPSVVAAALHRYGRDCPPLVCTSGWPNTAVIELLRQLARAGVELAYHGDFDGDGLRIAAYVMTKTGATPWRMASDDYLRSLKRLGHTGPSAGRVPDAPWDAELGRTMRERGVAVYEEQVTKDLLGDLAPVVKR